MERALHEILVELANSQLELLECALRPYLVSSDVEMRVHATALLNRARENVQRVLTEHERRATI